MQEVTVKAFLIIAKYFWVVAMAVTSLNAIFFKYQSKQHINDNPDLAGGYEKMIRGYLFWLNIPWFVMGIGCILGGVPTVFHFLRPKDGNVFVIAWWLSVFILWIVSFYWIFFQKGAEKLAKYRMVYYHSPGKSGYISNPTHIKLIYLLCLTGGLIAAVWMWTANIALPSFLSE